MYGFPGRRPRGSGRGRASLPTRSSSRLPIGGASQQKLQSFPDESWESPDTTTGRTWGPTAGYPLARPPSFLVGPTRTQLQPQPFWSANLLPVPPASGLPRANERRIRNPTEDHSDTSVRSTEEEDDFGALNDFHPPDGTLPPWRPEPKPMQSSSLLSLAAGSRSNLAAISSNLQMNGAFFDPWRGSNDGAFLTAGPNPMMERQVLPSQPPPLAPPPLSALLRTLFPEWATVPVNYPTAYPAYGLPSPTWYEQPQAHFPTYGPFGPKIVGQQQQAQKSKPPKGQKQKRHKHKGTGERAPKNEEI